MPIVTSYVSVPGTDNPIVLPDAQSNLNDFHSLPFNAPGVVQRFPAVLFWMVKPEGRVRVQINLNDQIVRVVLFDSTPQRSWHEVIQEPIVLAQGNVLDVAVLADEEGPG